jgi:hypothetical protein
VGQSGPGSSSADGSRGKAAGQAAPEPSAELDIDGLRESIGRIERLSAVDPKAATPAARQLVTEAAGLLAEAQTRSDEPGPIPGKYSSKQIALARQHAMLVAEQVRARHGDALNSALRGVLPLMAVLLLDSPPAESPNPNKMMQQAERFMAGMAGILVGGRPQAPAAEPSRVQSQPETTVGPEDSSDDESSDEDDEDVSDEDESGAGESAATQVGSSQA